MRQKRAKAYKKQLTTYTHTFKFRQPYQVLLDDSIILETDRCSFNLIKGLQRTLQADIKPMITQCCMQVLYESKNQKVISQAKQYERRRCNHLKEPKKPEECISSIVDINGSNMHRYIVATQNIDIRRKLRHIPGVPLIYINRSVMIMEPLSVSSARVANQKETEKLYKGLNDPNNARLISNSSQLSNSELKKKKNLKPRQPNPLSVKKRKVSKKEDTVSTHRSKKKRTQEGVNVKNTTEIPKLCDDTNFKE